MTTKQAISIPRNEELLEEYEAAWSIPSIFSLNGNPAPGIVTTHDQFAISWTPEEAAAKVERLLATSSEDEARAQWRLCSQNQWQYDQAKQELAGDSWREQIKPVLYRPFDVRATVFDRNVAVHRRERVMCHMLAGPNLGLCVGRAGQVIGSDTWEIVFASKFSSDFNLFRRGGNCLFPLYIYSTEKYRRVGERRVPNLNSDFVKAFSSATTLDFIPEGTGDLKTTFGPEDVLHYLYSVLHSPEYRCRYADFLKSDFPRVPVTNCAALFESLAALGKRLTALHLMEAEDGESPGFPVAGSNRVEKVRYAPPQKRVWINSEQYFDGIAPDTWEFTIGGYQPAEKWLKDRKNRPLSYDDIAHYQSLCTALAETPRIMASIDETIDAYGGWPLVQEDYLRGLYQTMSEEWTSPEDEEAWRDL